MWMDLLLMAIALLPWTARKPAHARSTPRVRD